MADSAARWRDRPEPQAGGILGAALVSALLYSTALVHALMAPLAAISPLPLLVVRVRSGLAPAALAGVAAAAVLSAIFSPGQAIAFVLTLAVPALLIAEAVVRGRGLVRGCGWAFAALGCQVALALFFASPQMRARALGPLDQSRSPEFLQEMRATGLPPEQVEAWSQQVGVARDVLAVVYPAAYVIMAALVVLANAALLRLYLARVDPAWLDGGEFERVRWPLGLVVLFVAAGASVLAAEVRPAAYNVLLVAAFFFALQGLAVVAFYTRRLAAPPLLRAAALLLVLLNPWAPQILGLLGLFDNWFDFRKWAEPPPPGRA